MNLSIPSYQSPNGLINWDWEFLSCTIALVLLVLVNFYPRMLILFLYWVMVVGICFLTKKCQRTASGNIETGLILVIEYL